MPGPGPAHHSRSPLLFHLSALPVLLQEGTLRVSLRFLLFHQNLALPFFNFLPPSPLKGELDLFVIIIRCYENAFLFPISLFRGWGYYIVNTSSCFPKNSFSTNSSPGSASSNSFSFS